MTANVRLQAFDAVEITSCHSFFDAWRHVGVGFPAGAAGRHSVEAELSRTLSAFVRNVPSIGLEHNRVAFVSVQQKREL